MDSAFIDLMITQANEHGASAVLEKLLKWDEDLSDLIAAYDQTDPYQEFTLHRAQAEIAEAIEHLSVYHPEE